MVAFKDLSGQRFGKLLVIGRCDGQPKTRWVCQCDCGEQKTIYGSNINRQISCGCLGSRATFGDRAKRHGHAVGFEKTKTFAAWRNAKTRCFNENTDNWSAYGGRGITMCKEWADDFSNFLRDMGECPEGLTLDRRNVNGNYEPGNCRWITQKEQSANTRQNIFVETDNGRVILKEFAAINSVSYKMLHRRVRKLGETPEQGAEWLLAKKHRVVQTRI